MIFIIATGFVLMLLIAFLCYASKLNFVIKLITLPLFFLFSGLVTYNYIDNLGKPIERPLPEKFDYQHHRIVDSETIYVWLSTKEKGDLLYIISYDRETAKKLEEAKEQQEGGGNPSMEQVLDGKTGQRTWQVEESETQVETQSQETK